MYAFPDADNLYVEICINEGFYQYMISYRHNTFREILKQKL